MDTRNWLVVIAIVFGGASVIGVCSRGLVATESDGIAAYCGDTYTLDVSPLRTKVSCRGEEFVIFPNVDEMSPEEFRAYLDAKEGIPVGLKRDLREK